MDKTNWCNGFYVQFRHSFTKETFSYNEYLKGWNIQYWKPEVRERKKTGVHGTLEMTLKAWKLNSKNLLLNRLFSRMNSLKAATI